MNNRTLGKQGKEQPPTCHLCDQVDVLVKKAKDLGVPTKTRLHLRTEVDRQHVICDRCQIRFGGTHAGGPVPVPEDQHGMCLACCYKYLPETFVKTAV